MQVYDIVLPRGNRERDYDDLAIEIAGISLRAGLRHQGAILSTDPVCLLINSREKERERERDSKKPSDRINI